MIKKDCNKIELKLQHIVTEIYDKLKAVIYETYEKTEEEIIIYLE